MSECCCPSPQESSSTQMLHLCPIDRTKGSPVQLITLKSLLKPTALEWLNAADKYRFCPSHNCSVTYFSEQGQVFTVDDLKVPVFQKDSSETVSICYCFGWNRRRINEEIEKTGKSSAVDAIASHIQAKRCGCEVKNPQGTCCLANIRSVVQQVLEQKS